MKYMTPELITLFRSEDDAIAEPAADEWQQRCEAYTLRLKEIRSQLPVGVRRLLHYHLHDARVLAITADEVPFLSIFLEQEMVANPRDKYLELRYRLVGRTKGGLDFIKHDVLRDDGKPLAWWMYDEIDVCDGTVPSFTHSILLTGGCEFQLTFFNVKCRRLDFLFPPIGQAGEVDVAEVERLVRLPA